MNDVEAVEKARIFRPDIVLMDISMPQMNGLMPSMHVGRRISSKRKPQSSISSNHAGGGFSNRAV